MLGGSAKRTSFHGREVDEALECRSLAMTEGRELGSWLRADDRSSIADKAKEQEVSYVSRQFVVLVRKSRLEVMMMVVVVVVVMSR